MLGEFGWFIQTFGATPTGDLSQNVIVAKAAVKQGLAVVLLHPGKKIPICTIPDAEARRLDASAQQEARDRGHANAEKVRHNCGITHAITEPKHFSRKKVKDILESGANLAVALGRGTRRTIVVDIDTSRQMEKFRELWNQNQHGDNEVHLTVSSPGTVIDGQWIHEGGGHVWLDLPESWEPPQTTGKFTHPDGWAVYYGSGYVLVPPSVRPEGPYECVGDSYPAPAWLLDMVSQGSDKPRAALADDGGPIDKWSQDHSWSDLLSADGYTSDSHDACGCPTYTRPGSPAHAKSVTGHEVGCPRYDTTMGHGPLHVWSDALRETLGDTVSKLTYVAITRYHGDMSAALECEGITAPVKAAKPFVVAQLPKVLSPYQRRMMLARKKTEKRNQAPGSP